MTTLTSHRSTTGFADAREALVDNLRHLDAAGVRLVLGTDNHRPVQSELEALAATGALTPQRIVTIATRDTPRWIFPDRRLASFDIGAEASFLVLLADPRQDLAALTRPTLRVWHGQALD